MYVLLGGIVLAIKDVQYPTRLSLEHLFCSQPECGRPTRIKLFRFGETSCKAVHSTKTKTARNHAMHERMQAEAGSRGGAFSWSERLVDERDGMCVECARRVYYAYRGYRVRRV